MITQKSKSKKLKKCKIFTWLIILLTLLLICFAFFSLQKLLYNIQLEERLDKIEDYSTFVLTISPQKRATKRYLFSFHNNKYYYEGIEQIYASYGSTQIFLEDAIKRGFIKIEDILANCTLVTESDSITEYIHSSQKEEKNFKIRIEKKEDLTEITFSR